MHRSLAGLVALLVLLAACTTGSPDPSPSATSGAPSTPGPSSSPSSPPPGRVAVVVAPEPALAAAAAEIGTRSVTAGLLDRSELRVVTADEPSFVRDLTTFFATEGFDLVCVVGAGAEGVVRQVAPTAPNTRFCAAPARPADMPPNVLAIDVRTEELGYVAGVALAADGVTPTVGLATAPSTWAPRRIEAGLAAGLAAGGLDGPRVSLVGPIRDDEGADEQARGLLEAGIAGVLSLTGAPDAAVRDVLADVPVTEPEPPAPTEGTESPSPEPTTSETETPPRMAGLVGGPEVRPGEDGAPLADVVLLVLELHLEEAVHLAVERHVDGWSTEPLSVGLADGAFRVDVGDGPRATAVADAVEQAVEAIRTGDVEVPRG